MKISSPDAGQNHSYRTLIPKSLPNFFPHDSSCNPVCSSCRSQRPGKCRCRHTPSRESEYTLSPTALSVFYREIAIRISAYFEDHRNFYRVDFVGERMCLLYLRTVNAARDFYAFSFLARSEPEQQSVF